MSAGALQYTRDYQKKIPFVAHLKILTEALGQGTARLSLPIEPHLTNSLGTVHGGVIMSLLDVALCTAARTLHPESVGVVTIDMSTSFICGDSAMISGRPLFVRSICARRRWLSILSFCFSAACCTSAANSVMR